MRPRIVVLHIFSKGGIALNSESALDGQLAGRLREIYGTRAERVPYLCGKTTLLSSESRYA